MKQWRDDSNHHSISKFTQLQVNTVRNQLLGLLPQMFNELVNEHERTEGCECVWDRLQPPGGPLEEDE